MIAIAWALLGVGCAPVCGDLALLEQRECAVEAAIETLHASYPKAFIEDKGLDLERIYGAWWVLPAGYSEPEAFGLALQRGVTQLRDGHTGVIGAHAPIWLNDVRLHPVDGAWVAAHTPLGVPGLLPGDVVLSIDNVPIDEALDDALAIGSSEAGRALSRVQSAFADGGVVAVERDGAVLGVSILGRNHPGGHAFEHAHHRGVDVLRVSSFEQRESVIWLDERMNDIAASADALVLDLRGNGGGSAWAVESFLGRLFEEAPEDYPILDPEGEPWVIRGRVIPRGTIYTGPLAVLVDADSASAAHYVAHRVRQAGRGIVCGLPSGGGAGLPRLSTDLAPGLQLISIDRYLVGPDGEDLELGLDPDPVCAASWTRAQLVEGLDAERGDPARDLALDLALRALGAS